MKSGLKRDLALAVMNGCLVLMNGCRVLMADMGLGNRRRE
jgi:hypothetical protein